MLYVETPVDVVGRDSAADVVGRDSPADVAHRLGREVQECSFHEMKCCPGWAFHV